mgnify:CR=1 FL=1
MKQLKETLAKYGIRNLSGKKKDELIKAYILISAEIAKDYFTRSVINLVEKATNIYKLDRILLVIGNDFYNADGKSGATTAGTPQDCDSRWYKMFKEGLELIYNDNIRTNNEFYVDNVIEPLIKKGYTIKIFKCLN